MLAYALSKSMYLLDLKVIGIFLSTEGIMKIAINFKKTWSC